MTAPPDDWEWGVPAPVRPLFRAGHWLLWWEANPAGAQAKADALGLEVSDLLCRGCEARRQRLIGEGLWAA